MFATLSRFPDACGVLSNADIADASRCSQGYTLWEFIDCRQYQKNQIGATQRTPVDKLAGGKPVSRSDLYRNLAIESEELMRGMSDLCVLTRVQESVLYGRQQHCERRAALSENCLVRILAAINELLKGNTRKYADGFASAIRDVESL